MNFLNHVANTRYQKEAYNSKGKQVTIIQHQLVSNSSENMRRHMNRKFSTILTFLLLLALSTSTVGAAGAIKLSGGFTAGSIHFDGTATGVGGYSDGITVALVGIGIPVVTCTNQGGNQSPGQNPPKIQVGGSQYIPEDQITSTTKKGKTPVGVSADESNVALTGTQGGCPNDNWIATITSVEWTGAILSVYSGDSTSGPLLVAQVYTCDPSKRVGNVLYCTRVS